VAPAVQAVPAATVTTTAVRVAIAARVRVALVVGRGVAIAAPAAAGRAALADRVAIVAPAIAVKVAPVVGRAAIVAPTTVVKAAPVVAIVGEGRGAIVDPVALVAHQAALPEGRGAIVDPVGLHVRVAHPMVLTKVRVAPLGAASAATAPATMLVALPVKAATAAPHVRVAHRAALRVKVASAAVVVAIVAPLAVAVGLPALAGAVASVVAPLGVVAAASGEGLVVGVVALAHRRLRQPAWIAVSQLAARLTLAVTSGVTNTPPATTTRRAHVARLRLQPAVCKATVVPVAQSPSVSVRAPSLNCQP